MFLSLASDRVAVNSVAVANRANNALSIDKTHIAARMIMLGFVLLSIGCEQSNKHADSPEEVTKAKIRGIEEDEMGHAGRSGPSAWDAADPKLKAEFVVELKNAKKQNLPVYEKYLPKLGIDAILGYLEEKSSRCHAVAHNLGKALYVQNQDLNKSLDQCANRCTSACMHGVISEALGNQSHANISAKVVELCRKGSMAKLHKPGNCAHAMGHALMLNTGGEIRQSLGECKLFKEPGMDYYCATGVYMQYRDWVRDGTLSRKDVALHYPCDTYKSFPAACYRYIMSHILRAVDNNLGSVIDECLNLPTNRRHGCFHGLGKKISSRLVRNPQLLAAVCLTSDRNDQTMCIEGAIEKLADYGGTYAKDACATVTGYAEEVCSAAMREKMYRLNKPSMPMYRVDAEFVDTKNVGPSKRVSAMH